MMDEPTILDEYCRYYSDFSKMLSIYVKSAYPKVDFDFAQLLDASYNVWHRLNDEEKISLANFLEENQNLPSKAKAFNGVTSSEFSAKTAYGIYLKDERRKLVRRHANISMREINKRLSERWRKMSHRLKSKYEYRSYLAKKRWYKKQGRTVQLRKPSFIQRKTT